MYLYNIAMFCSGKENITIPNPLRMGHNHREKYISS
jgi:hypothetical protein